MPRPRRLTFMQAVSQIQNLISDSDEEYDE